MARPAPRQGWRKWRKQAAPRRSGRSGAGSQGLLFNLACALCVAAPLLVCRFGWRADAAAGVFLLALLLNAIPLAASLAKFDLPEGWSVGSGALAALATGAMAFVSVTPPVPADMRTAGALAALGQAVLAMESDAPQALARWRGALALAPLAAGLALRRTPEAYIGVAGVVAVMLATLLICRRLQRVTQTETEADVRLTSALNGVSQCFGLFGAGQLCLSGNADFLRLFKLTADQARARTLTDLMSRRLALPLKDRGDIDRLLDLADAARKKKLRQKLCVDLTGDRIMEFVFSPTPDGLSLQVEDVTRRRAEEIRIERMARTDDVTGMANRAAFREMLEKASAEAASNPFAIFMIDLDRFKQVNDTMGHAAGDKLLGRVAKRLVDLAGEGEEVARLGGDEFVVLTRMDREAVGPVRRAHRRGGERALSDRRLETSDRRLGRRGAGAGGFQQTPRT